ncbi:unnamed protein product, partial [Mesorhabditis belari]|uniref:Transthyretin-like family protein n=1 Tax=Mesorhabditis belari TaxID=2138241 RepID=A0AAF3EPW3_9BILA
MKFLLLSILISVAAAKVSTIKVTGTVLCKKQKQPGLEVVLKESDSFTPDDKLSQTTTNKDGFFEISGQDDEWGSIEPYVYIFHHCRILKEGCRTRSRYDVPQSAINGVYEMSYIALDIAQSSETYEC